MVNSTGNPFGNDLGEGTNGNYSLLTPLVYGGVGLFLITKTGQVAKKIIDQINEKFVKPLTETIGDFTREVKKVKIEVRNVRRVVDRALGENGDLENHINEVRQVADHAPILAAQSSEAATTAAIAAAAAAFPMLANLLGYNPNASTSSNPRMRDRPTSSSPVSTESRQPSPPPEVSATTLVDGDRSPSAEEGSTQAPEEHTEDPNRDIQSQQPQSVVEMAEDFAKMLKKQIPRDISFILPLVPGLIEKALTTLRFFNLDIQRVPPYIAKDSLVDVTARPSSPHPIPNNLTVRLGNLIHGAALRPNGDEEEHLEKTQEQQTTASMQILGQTTGMLMLYQIVFSMMKQKPDFLLDLDKEIQRQIPSHLTGQERINEYETLKRRHGYHIKEKNSFSFLYNRVKDIKDKKKQIAAFIKILRQVVSRQEISFFTKSFINCFLSIVGNSLSGLVQSSASACLNFIRDTVHGMRGHPLARADGGLFSRLSQAFNTLIKIYKDDFPNNPCAGDLTSFVKKAINQPKYHDGLSPQALYKNFTNTCINLMLPKFKWIPKVNKVVIVISNWASRGSLASKLIKHTLTMPVQLLMYFINYTFVIFFQWLSNLILVSTIKWGLNRYKVVQNTLESCQEALFGTDAIPMPKYAFNRLINKILNLIYEILKEEKKPQAIPDNHTQFLPIKKTIEAFVSNLFVVLELSNNKTAEEMKRAIASNTLTGMPQRLVNNELVKILSHLLMLVYKSFLDEQKNEKFLTDMLKLFNEAIASMYTPSSPTDEEENQTIIQKNKETLSAVLDLALQCGVHDQFQDLGKTQTNLERDYVTWLKNTLNHGQNPKDDKGLMADGILVGLEKALTKDYKTENIEEQRKKLLQFFENLEIQYNTVRADGNCSPEIESIQSKVIDHCTNINNKLQELHDTHWFNENKQVYREKINNLSKKLNCFEKTLKDIETKINTFCSAEENIKELEKIIDDLKTTYDRFELKGRTYLPEKLRECKNHIHKQWIKAEELLTYLKKKQNAQHCKDVLKKHLSNHGFLDNSLQGLAPVLHTKTHLTPLEMLKQLKKELLNNPTNEQKEKFHSLIKYLKSIYSHYLSKDEDLFSKPGGFFAEIANATAAVQVDNLCEKLLVHITNMQKKYEKKFDEAKEAILSNIKPTCKEDSDYNPESLKNLMNGLVQTVNEAESLHNREPSLPSIKKALRTFIEHLQNFLNEKEIPQQNPDWFKDLENHPFLIILRKYAQQYCSNLVERFTTVIPEQAMFLIFRQLIALPMINS